MVRKNLNQQSIGLWIDVGWIKTSQWRKILQPRKYMYTYNIAHIKGYKRNTHVSDIFSYRYPPKKKHKTNKAHCMISSLRKRISITGLVKSLTVAFRCIKGAFTWGFPWRFTMENWWLTMKELWFTMEKWWLTMEKWWFTMKNGDLPWKMGMKQDSNIPSRHLTWFHCGFVPSQMGIWMLDQHFLKGNAHLGMGQNLI